MMRGMSWRSLARPARGFAVGVAGVAVLVAALFPVRDDVTRATPALLLVLPVLAAALVGGRGPAVATALVAAVGFSLGFIPPVGSLRVNLPEDTLALAVFLAVAAVAGALVARERDGRRVAEQRADEIHTMYVEYRRVVAEREALAAEAARVQTLEEVDRQRGVLLRSVSHDLRTPLSAIRAVATDLRGGFTYDDRLRDELLDLMADEADRLDRIVGNLLSMSRIEAGALLPALTAVDVEELIEAATIRLARLFVHHPLSIEVAAELPLVAADPVQIDQVLTNLLENAVRHTPPGTAVFVRAAPSAGGVCLSVSDAGPGLDAALAPRLFEPFQSGGPATTGVGLAICKAIVEAHRGTLQARASREGGAELSFNLAPA
jgi:two-component system, OmpR family, sensor histidine kinase KdpD